MTTYRDTVVDLYAIAAVESPFCLNALPPLDDLKILRESVAAFGILTPLWVKERADHQALDLVHGFSRWKVLEALGIFRVSVRIFPIGADGAYLLRQTLSENAATRGLSLLEKIQAPLLLKKFGADDKDIIQKDLPGLGFPPQESVYRTLLKINGLPQDLLSLLSEKKTPFKRVLPFLALDARAQEFILRAGRRLGASLSQLETLARHVGESARRDGCAPSAILDSWGADGIFPADAAGSNEAPGLLEKILKAAFACRYPELSRQAQAMAGKSADLAWPAGLQLHWDPVLEETRLSLEIAFRKPEDIDEMSQALSDPTRQKILKDLMSELQ